MKPVQGWSVHGSIRRHMVVALASVAILAGGVGGWAVTTELAGAVIAQGSLVVDTKVKKVQHLTGGVVGELLVREGDKVKAGQVVVRLDDTQTRASLQIVLKQLDELLARQARDEAERDGAERVAFPAELESRRQDPAVQRLLSGEQNLFEIRRSARAGQKAQLQERIAQLGAEIQGLTEQVSWKGRETGFIQQELGGVRDLWAKNLIPINRVTALERDAARIQGERGQLLSTIAQAKGKVAETELQILQINQDLGTEVGKDLADIRGKISELLERRIAADDQLKRVEIKAPLDGTVHQLDVHTVGGVIKPGDTLMEIVPQGERLIVEAKIQPQDVDSIRPAQAAVMRFSAFNQRTTPELNGEVSFVSADISTDQRTAANYYLVQIAVPEAEIARLEGLRLVPGMPVEAFVQTSPRTVMSYLVRPLQDQIARAWREK